MCFLEVDEAHVQWKILLLDQFLEPAYSEHHIDCGSIRWLAALRFWEDSLLPVVGAEASRKYLEHHLVRVGHERVPR